MSGKRINFQQLQLYMKAKKSGLKQETAAAMAGISVRTASRIENGTHQPQQGRSHDWRTRPDPLAGVWEKERCPQCSKTNHV